jgi:hypothetical protein
MMMVAAMWVEILKALAAGLLAFLPELVAWVKDRRRVPTEADRLHQGQGLVKAELHTSLEAGDADAVAAAFEHHQALVIPSHMGAGPGPGVRGKNER